MIEEITRINRGDLGPMSSIDHVLISKNISENFVFQVFKKRLRIDHSPIGIFVKKNPAVINNFTPIVTPRIEENNFRCSKCFEVFSTSLPALKVHLLKCEANKIACEICNEVFYNKKCKKLHTEWHVRDDKYKACLV